MNFVTYDRSPGVSQAGWRGDHRKEQDVKRAMFDVLGDQGLVEDLFKVVTRQSEF